MRLPHSTPSIVPSIVGCGGAVAVAWPWHVYEMPWVSTRPTAARASHRRCECSATAKLPSLVGDVKSIALSAPHSHRSLPSLAPIAPPRTFNAPSLAPSLSHTHVRARACAVHTENQPGGRCNTSDTAPCRYFRWTKCIGVCRQEEEEEEEKEEEEKRKKKR